MIGTIQLSTSASADNCSDISTSIAAQHAHRLLNSTAVSFPSACSISESFLRVCAKYPHRQAVVLDDLSLTYHQLSERTHQQCAQWTKQYASRVKPGSVIAQCVHRSIEMIIGMISIQLMGCIYCPLNPADPDDRLRKLITDTKATLLLTQKHLLGRMNNVVQNPPDEHDQQQCICVVIDEHSSSTCTLPNSNTPIPNTTHTVPSTAIASQSIVTSTTYLSPESPLTIPSFIPVSVDPSSVAYLIHTSGSTGTPKSLCATHVNLYNGMCGYEHVGVGWRKDDRVLQLAACSFDAHAVESMGSLTVGATVVMIKEGGNLDFDYLIDVFRRQRITTVFMVPSIAVSFAELITSSQAWSSMSSLRCFALGGEAVPVHLISLLHHHLSTDCIIMNGYGPAECFVYSTFYKTSAEDVKRQSTPIGRKLLLSLKIR